MAEAMTDRITRKAEAMPDWVKWLGGCAIGGISSAITIGIMIGVSQTRLDGAEKATETNRADITAVKQDVEKDLSEVKKNMGDLKVRVETSVVRSEEQYRSIMSALKTIERRLP